MTPGFAPVAGLDGVYVARAGKLRSVALRLRDNTLCLYSPVAGLETALRDQQGELGDVSILFAPNHYHNKGLAAHREVFPDASFVCSPAARPRLTRLTGMDFAPLDDLAGQLVNGQSLHEPEGLKTGEVWVRVRSTNDCGLIVTDAFTSAPDPKGRDSGKVRMLPTFPRYGVEDANVYKAWALRFLSTEPLSVLLPCHGSPVRAGDLAAQLNALVQKAF